MLEVSTSGTQFARSKPEPKKGLHINKTFLSVWLDMKGFIHYEVLKENQTVTVQLYCQQLQILSNAAARKCPALVNQKGIIL